MRCLEPLTEFAGGYAYYYDTERDGPGSLIVRDETGDTVLPPYSGRWTILEPAENRDAAVRKARAWIAAE